MRAALIGLGMVSRTYGEAVHNSKTVSLDYIHARSATSCASFLEQWPDLHATAADGVLISQAIHTLDLMLLMRCTGKSARSGSCTQLKDI